MADPSVPYLAVPTASRSPNHSAPTPSPSVGGNSHSDALHGCSDAESNVVPSWKPSIAEEASDRFGDDTAPVEDEIAVQQHHRVVGPSTSELKHGTSNDPIEPQYAPELCLSPSRISTATRSEVGAPTRSVSHISSATSSEEGDQTGGGSSKTPCRCAFIAAARIMQGAKERALQYAKAQAIKHTDEHGNQTQLVRRWMVELITSNIDQAQVVAVRELQRTMKDVLGRNWPMHELMEINQLQPGHVQPWMRALLHKESLRASLEAFAAIDAREGRDSQTRPPFLTDPLAYPDLELAHQPCACKDAHATSIAARTLEEAMTKLASFITAIAQCIPGQDRAALHKQIYQKMRTELGHALHQALEAIAAPTDIAHLCTTTDMRHVEPWMTKSIQKLCRQAALRKCKAVRWKARDAQIRWFGNWLELLYREDAEDELAMAEAGLDEMEDELQREDDWAMEDAQEEEEPATAGRSEDVPHT